MPRIKFEVTSEGTFTKVKVGNKVFPFPKPDGSPGDGSLVLKPGQHTVDWFSKGEAGHKFKVVGKDGDRVVVTRSATADDEGRSFGGRDFNV